MADRIRCVLLLWITSYCFVARWRGVGAMGSSSYWLSDGSEQERPPDVGLHWLVEPSDAVVREGGKTVLRCRVSTTRNDKKAAVTWRLNGTDISAADDSLQTPDGDLVIPHTSVTDQGEYSCMAKAGHLVMVSKSAMLDVAHMESEFGVMPEILSTNEGENIRLVCDARATPTARYSWFYENTSLDANDDRLVSVPSGGLYIISAKKSDSGKYSCSAKNAYFDNHACSYSFVNVFTRSEGKPISFGKLNFVSPPLGGNNVTLVEGKDLVLECAASQSDGVEVNWIYKTDEFEKRIALSSTKNGLNILTKRATIADSGIYTCEVELLNSNDGFAYSIRQSVAVQVGTPPVIHKGPASAKVLYGKRVRLKCNATGHPEPIIWWLHNGRKLPKRGRNFVQMDSELVLPLMSKENAGLYQCGATNSLGSVLSPASRLTFYHSESEPKPPDKVSCETLDESRIRVSWEAQSAKNLSISVVNPFFKRNSTASSPSTMPSVYSVHYWSSDGGENRSEIAISESKEIDKLNAGTEYEFYVTFYNKESMSMPSETVKCATYPSKASNIEISLQVVDVYSDWIRVAWNKSDLLNEEATYILQWKSESAPSSGINEIKNCNETCSITNLLPEMTYSIRIFGTDLNKMTAKSKWLKITMPKSSYMPPPRMEVTLLNSTAMQIAWSMKNDSLEVDEFELYYRPLEATFERVVVLPKSYSHFVVDNLVSNTTYIVGIRAIRDQTEGQAFEQTVSTRYEQDARLDHSVFIVNSQANSLTTYNVPGAVRNMMWGMVNESCVRISWEAPVENYSANLSYVVFYSSNAKLPVLKWPQIRVPPNQTSVDINGLKENVEYFVAVRGKNIEGSFGNLSNTITVWLEDDPQPERSLGLTTDQIFGVLIGIGIGVCFIMIAFLTVCGCKRRMSKKRNRRMHHFSAPSSACEMTPIDHSRDIHRNGYNGEQLLPLVSRMDYFTGSGVAKLPDKPKHYSLEKPVKDECNYLMTVDSNPANETVLTTVDESPIEGGGDSGYCDRNLSQSPQSDTRKVPACPSSEYGDKNSSESPHSEKQPVSRNLGYCEKISSQSPQSDVRTTLAENVDDGFCEVRVNR